MMTAERTVASRFEQSGVQMPMGTSSSSDPAMLKPRTIATLPDATDPTQRGNAMKKASLDELLPPLDLRVLERRDSTTTSSSSSSPGDDSESSSDFDDEDVDPFVQDGGDDFLVKPMSMLPVCPLDDFAVEEERRRRRNVRMIKHDKNNRVHCPDAESLPSPTSPHGGTIQRRFPTSHVAAGSDVTRPQLSAQLLRRDSMVIRQQYWKQLGLSLPQRDLERNTGAGQRRPRHVGVKVRLNDSNANKNESKSIFQIIASWYASEDKSARKNSDATPPLSVPVDGDENSGTSQRKSIRFCEEAEMFYIPLHRDYSKRQRDCMWHTRSEFIAMVERNLDDVYEEMEREYEEQVQAEAAENDAMAKEEARQRAYEAQVKAKAADQARVAALSPPLQGTPQQRAPMGSPGSSPPMLALCPIATQIKVTPRARSPHDIRFKYLKHLGINNK